MKNFDIDQLLAHVQSRLSGGRPTMPESVLKVEAGRPDVDLQEELNKRAESYMNSMLDEPNHKSVKLDGLDATVLNLQDKHKAILRSLSMEKQAALKSLAEKMKKVAAELDEAGLAKQAADLRATAKKIS